MMTSLKESLERIADRQNVKNCVSPRFTPKSGENLTALRDWTICNSAEYRDRWKNTDFLLRAKSSFQFCLKDLVKLMTDASALPGNACTEITKRMQDI